MNTKERCDLVRAMELLVRSVNNEDYIMTWLRMHPVWMADHEQTHRTIRV